MDFTFQIFAVQSRSLYHRASISFALIVLTVDLLTYYHVETSSASQQEDVLLIVEKGASP